MFGRGSPVATHGNDVGAPLLTLRGLFGKLVIFAASAEDRIIIVKNRQIRLLGENNVSRKKGLCFAKKKIFEEVFDLLTSHYAQSGCVLDLIWLKRFCPKQFSAMNRTGMQRPMAA